MEVKGRQDEMLVAVLQVLAGGGSGWLARRPGLIGLIVVVEALCCSLNRDVAGGASEDM